ncbi:MAG: hypothetical protein ACN6OP_19195 [Pseudomonadales bacterium]
MRPDHKVPEKKTAPPAPTAPSSQQAQGTPQYAHRALAAMLVSTKRKSLLTALSASSLHVLRQALNGDTNHLDMVPRILRDLDHSVDKTIGEVTQDIESAIRQGRPELVKVLLKRISHLLK